MNNFRDRYIRGDYKRRGETMYGHDEEDPKGRRTEDEAGGNDARTKQPVSRKITKSSVASLSSTPCSQSIFLSTYFILFISVRQQMIFVSAKRFVFDFRLRVLRVIITTPLTGAVGKGPWRCITWLAVAWCNDYRRRKWTRRHELKSWTRLIAFHIALIPLGKVWIQ